jgi:hypothetical protein
MILFLVANPEMDAMHAINILVDEKLRAGDLWGTGFPYASLPNQGANMRREMFVSGGREQNLPGRSFSPAPLSQPVLPSLNDSMTCKRPCVGRIIGSKGSTIKEIQQRSGTVIRINQDVPFGADCEIRFSGSTSGVEMAKEMILQIIGTGSQPGINMNHGNTGGYVIPQPPQQSIKSYMQQTQNHVVYQQTAYPMAPVPVPAPVAIDPGWKAISSPDGQIYYWNERTGVSQWQKPSGMV